MRASPLPTVALIASLLLVPALASGTESMRAAPELQELLRQGVEFNMRGDFDAADGVWAEAKSLYPNDPSVPVYQVSTLYWRQTFDESNREFDDAIERNTNRALEISLERIERDDTDAVAHLYAGEAYILLARLDVVRDRYIKAGRSGELSRYHLERALELDPQLVDAKHPLGMYYFYASVLPSVMKWFSWLPFMPRGDGPLGLAYLEDARANGDLHRWDASFILLNIKTYLAPDLDEALVLARDLHQRFPDNSLFHFEVIEVLTERGDWHQVIAETTKLESQPGTNYHDEGRRRMAPVWRAGAELQLGRPDQAWAELERFGNELPEQPTWAAAWITLQRGRTLDVMGKRHEAEKHYRQVVAFEPPRHSFRAAELAEQGLEAPYVTGVGSAAAE